MAADGPAEGGRGALDGLIVLDCTHVVAGAWCAMILADLGASVIKIEGPRGDMLRSRSGARGFSAFDHINRNKRGLAIDLAQAEGQAILRRLAGRADVFVENYRPGALDRMSLGYETLSAVNPRLVYCSVSGFGREGPYSARGGLDLVAQAMSGMMSFTGESDRAPLPHPVPISDLNAGTFAALGILAALTERHRSGRGQHLETTLLGSAFAYTVLQAGEYLANGHVATRSGATGSAGTPYEPFPTADDDIVIAASAQGLWQRAADVLGDSELGIDPRFSTYEARYANRAALRERIVALLAEAPAAVWIARFAAAGIPAGRINDVAAAVKDPQLKHLGAVVEIDGEAHLATPIRLGRTPATIRRKAPRLGEDSREILAEAGFSEPEVASLIDRKVIS